MVDFPELRDSTMYKLKRLVPLGNDQLVPPSGKYLICGVSQCRRSLRVSALGINNRQRHILESWEIDVAPSV